MQAKAYIFKKEGHFKMARKKIIAGNWKMNKTPSEAVALVNELKPLVANEDVDVVFCVPAIDIIPAMEAAKGSNICIGAENMYFEESGAYTGEISPAMLTDAGVKYVVLGHSERREYFAETDETVNKKVLKAFVDVVTEEMKKGEKVQLVGFGTFEVSERAAREGRNPQTGKTMKIEACKAPKFKAGKALKDAVNA